MKTKEGMRETMEKEKKSINCKGITVIALIITVIVLLILAGVALSAINGEDGILTKATNSKESDIIGKEKEEISIAYLDCKVENLGTTVESSKLENSLKNSGNDVFVVGSEILTIRYNETGHRYTINQDGKIEQIEDLTEENSKNIVDAFVVYGESILAETEDNSVYWVETTKGWKKIDLSEEKIITQNGIKQVEENFFLDEKGNVYLLMYQNSDTSMGYTCINEIEGNILNGIEIKEVFNTFVSGISMNMAVMLDNKGNIYACLYDYDGYDIRLVDDSYSDLNDISIQKVYFSEIYDMMILDTYGKLYIPDNNSQGLICINDKEQVLNGKIIKDVYEIEIGEESYVTQIILDDQGKVYTIWANNSWQLVNGTNSNSNIVQCISDIKESPLNNAKIEKIYTISTYIQYNVPYGITIIALDDKGKMYTWGYNESGKLENGTDVEYSNIPQCISNIEESPLNKARIEKIYITRW